MERLSEENGEYSNLGYIENVLDTSVFYDEVRTQQFLAGDLPVCRYASRLQIGMDVARVAMTAQWQNRSRVAAEQGPAYMDMSPDEKIALAEPRGAQLDDIRESLAPHRHRIQHINSLEAHIENLEGSGRSHLREGQGNVFGALKDFLNAPGTSVKDGAPTKAGFIKMPTGMGKTVIAVELVKALDHPKTLILTSRKDILHQTVGKDGYRGFSQFAPDAHVTTYYQDEQNLEGDTVVMTYASFNNLMAKGELPQNFCDLVICDEAHRALGEVTSKNLGVFIEGKIVVGLTATDEYAENKKVDQLLPEKIYDISLRECIDNGWLAPVQAWVYKTDVEIDQDKRREFSSVELSRLAQVEGRNRKAVEFAKEFVSLGVQGIISCIPGENVRHAADVAKRLRETEVVDEKTGEIRNIRAQELHGNMTTQERQAIYADYEAGKIDVLTFVDLLTEGWDSECAKFLINLRPTCSPVFSTQRFGRILRPTGKGFPAQVIEFIDETKKAQHTVLHALGEYRYKMGKVYGPRDWDEDGSYKLMHLPSYLARHISGVHMQRVTQVVSGRPYEADFSELMFVDDIASQFNLSVPGLLFIIEDLGFKTAVAHGSPSNCLLQLREIDRDKIAQVVHTQYRWLQERDEDWVQEYVIRRQNRLRDIQADLIFTAGVNEVDLLRSISGQELADEQDSERAAIRERRERRRELAVDHLKTDLDELIGKVAEGELSGADFKTIISMQTKANTVQPMSVMKLVMGGKKEGLWGEAQESLIQAMLYRPAVAASALSVAHTLGYIKNVAHDVRPRTREYHTYTTLTTKDDTVINVEASARDQRTTRQLASVYALASMVGVTTDHMKHPHRIGEAKENFILPGLDQAKSQLAGIFQKGKHALPVYENEGNPGGRTCVVARFILNGEEIKVAGFGKNNKQAGAYAAFRVLVMYDEELTELQHSVAVQRGAEQAASLQARIGLDKLNPEDDNFNPGHVLRQYCKLYQLGKPIYRHEHVEGGILHTVTVINKNGKLQTFGGYPMSKYVEGADKEKHMKLVIASKQVACTNALKALEVIPE